MDGIVVTSVDAVIEASFGLYGRGQVLVLRDVAGNIPRDGRLWNGLREVEFIGPDVIDRADRTAALAVTLSPGDIGHLSIGDAVRFVAGDGQSG